MSQLTHTGKKLHEICSYTKRFLGSVVCVSMWCVCDFEIFLSDSVQCRRSVFFSMYVKLNVPHCVDYNVQKCSAYYIKYCQIIIDLLKSYSNNNR